MNRLATDLDLILESTAPLWEELRGQRLFITGGTGFFGCWLLESFCWANMQLKLDATATVLTRSPEAFREKAPHLAQNPSVILHAGNILDFQFPAGKFSHVIHAATDATPSVDPREQLKTIVGGTERCLEFSLQAGTKKFLLTSSGAVYGPQPSELTHVGEEYLGGPDPAIPASAYGEGKRAAELLGVLAGRSGQIETKIARCFAFAGPYLALNAHFAIGNFIRDALRGGPIAIKGDGTPFRSYLYAADLAIWIWTILFRGISGRPYNVGSEDSLCIADLAKTVAATADSKTEVQILGTPSGHPPERYVPSTARARKELGLRQNTSLEEAIRRTMEWHRLLAQQSRGTTK